MSSNKNKTMNLLMEEFYRYESNNDLTKEERKALLEWVKDGNSVHENPSLAEDGHGNYIDFIDDYRNDEEIRKTINSLPPRERANYIARLQGEYTIDNLREDLNEAHFKLSVMEMVLKKYGLMEEVNKEIREAQARSKAFLEALGELSSEELPFD